MSEKGIEMRGKRAEYSEGIFGQIKWNMGFKRFLLRGLDKVDLEWGLLCLALNIKRMNKKDIEKLKEETMARVIFVSKNIINFLTRKSNSYRAGFSGFRVPILGHPIYRLSYEFIIISRKFCTTSF